VRANARVKEAYLGSVLAEQQAEAGRAVAAALGGGTVPAGENGGR